jgi:hypothetical protein
MGKDESRKPGGVVPFTLRQPRDDKKDLLRNKGRFSDRSNKDLKNSSGEGSVISLRRGFHGSDVVVDKYPREVDKETCISLLDDIGPVSEELAELLQIPDKIYLLGNDPATFSSRPDKDAAAISGYLILPTLKPRDAPDYALHIRSRGSHVFCTFVDKERRIIVHETVNSMYAERGSWESFEQALKKAIAKVKDYESQGIEFDFVLNKEGPTSPFKL